MDSHYNQTAREAVVGVLSLPFIILLKMPLEKIVNRLSKGIRLTKNVVRWISKPPLYIHSSKVIVEVKPTKDYFMPDIKPQYEISNSESDERRSDKKDEEIIPPSLFDGAIEYMFVDRFTQHIKRKVAPINTLLDELKEQKLVYGL